MIIEDTTQMLQDRFLGEASRVLGMLPVQHLNWDKRVVVVGIAIKLQQTHLMQQILIELQIANPAKAAMP